MLDEWAKQWGIPFAAVHDLRQRMGIAAQSADPVVEPAGKPGSEVRQQALIRLDANAWNVWLTRNNVGALMDERGIPVRYGLANESAAQNKVVKSGDLIGIRSILIGPQHMGQVIGQFASIECKKEGWKFNPKDKHEAAQLNWCEFVISKGGFATFATGPGIFNPQQVTR